MRWSRLGVLLFTAAALGCSDGKARIEGLVTLDGEPLAGDGVRATVVLEPEAGGAAAYAIVGADGRYRAATGSSPGVTPGAYAISLRAKRTIPSSDPNYPPRSEPITPSRYASSKTSGLRVEAEAGSNTLDLALTSAAE